MEYKNSAIVDPSRYDAQGLIADIPVRKNLYSEAEYVGIIRAQEDWNILVAPIGQFKGCLDPTMSFVSVSIPECRPERLEIISYFHEFGFIYDGKFLLSLSYACLTIYVAKDATENIAHDKVRTLLKIYQNDDVLTSSRLKSR
jgi:hypothetical protein